MSTQDTGTETVLTGIVQREIDLASAHVNDLAKALAEAQASIEQPAKNRVAKVTSRKGTGSSYEYRYADLSDVIEAIRAPMSKHGLAYTQAVFPVAGKSCLVTTLLHQSGQWIRSVYPLPGAMSSQEMGANLTYGRRYSLCALVGISGETDTDGAVGAPDTDGGAPAGDAVKEAAAEGRLKSAHDGHKITPEEVDRSSEAPPAGGSDRSLSPVLSAAMQKAGVTADQVKAYYVSVGHFPDTVDACDLPADYVAALTKTANWKKAVDKMKGA